MSALSYCMVLIIMVLLTVIHVAAIDVSVLAPVCVKPEDPCCPRRSLPRRYDINDLGYLSMFHGWVDVQGQGAANDYCRMVGNDPNIFLSCALAGTNGDSDNNYVSALTGFNRGHPYTWYMRDEDGDGRDDYCRCVGSDEVQQIVCTKAGPKGFYGSANQSGRTNTFTPTGNIDCSGRQVWPEFGRVSGFVILQ